MSRTIALIAVFLVVCTSIAFAALPQGPAATMDYTFEEFLSEYPEKQLLYSSNNNEYEKRKEIFMENLREVVEHNAQNHPWRKGLNQFSDLTVEEFLEQYTGHFVDQEAQADLHSYTQYRTAQSALGVEDNSDLIADMTNLPASVDWSSRGRFKKIKSQAKCGSCYSQVASALLSYYISPQAAGQEIDLSTQQAVSCHENTRQCGGSGGCKGSTSGLILSELAKDVGIVREEDYPYVSGNGEVPPCRFDPETMPVVAKTDGAERLKPNSPTELLRTLAFVGPASVSVNGAGVKTYYDGVLTNCTGPFNTTYNKYEVVLSHAMIAVGYGVNEDGIGYYRLQNSWGDNWSRDGTLYIYRPTNGLPETEYINTHPPSGYTCKDEDQSPFVVVGTCGVLANTWIPKNPKYIPPPQK